MEKRHNYNSANYHKKAYTNINKWIMLKVEHILVDFGEDKLINK